MKARIKWFEKQCKKCKRTTEYCFNISCARCKVRAKPDRKGHLCGCLQKPTLKEIIIHKCKYLEGIEK